MTAESNTDDSPLNETSEDTQEDKFLTFAIENEEYGIEVRNVTEIIGIQNITALPDVPLYVKGVINLRGKVIPVIDVRLRFELMEREYDERTCIIVVNVNNISLGLIVDAVSEVLGIPNKDIETPPTVNRISAGKFVQGLGKVENDVKIILDIHSLLFDGELEQIADATCT